VLVQRRVMTMLLVEETVKTVAMAAQVHKWQANISIEYLMVTSLRVEVGTVKRKEGSQLKGAMLVSVVVISLDITKTVRIASGLGPLNGIRWCWRWTRGGRLR
jgi:hypothetical protein